MDKELILEVHEGVHFIIQQIYDCGKMKRGCLTCLIFIRNVRNTGAGL